MKKFLPILKKVNNLEKTYEKLSDSEIIKKTEELKNTVKSGKHIDEILPDAFANVREAAKRTLGQINIMTFRLLEVLYSTKV